MKIGNFVFQEFRPSTGKFTPRIPRVTVRLALPQTHGPDATFYSADHVAGYVLQMARNMLGAEKVMLIRAWEEPYIR